MDLERVAWMGALNNYVALHYKSKHMSWLHSMWGIGASTGPYIMGYVLSSGSTWNRGCRIISIIQMVLTLILFLSLPLWKKDRCKEMGEKKKKMIRNVLATPAVKPILLCFFCYCSIEQTTGLWASSYLTLYKGMSSEEAASFASLFFIGITTGRILSGFLLMKLSDDSMVRVGFVILTIAVVILVLPLSSLFSLIGFMMIGLGCAPIYPSLIHSTPSHFGSDNSQSVIGLQMASAYVGTSLMPPLFGIIAERITVSLLPYYLLTLLILLVCMHTLMLKKMNSLLSS